jgi:SAM-dependent methyltransferase
MGPELIERLCQINRTFYAAFAASFSETRPESARDLDKIVPYIPHGARVLDLGCGNGRMVGILARHHRSVRYVGVDSSAEMIASCKKQEADHRSEGAGDKEQRVTFLVADIVQPDWTHSLPLSKTREPSEEGRWLGTLAPALRASANAGVGVFDCVLMLAVLHHIPDSTIRVRILRQVRDLLAPQGRAVVSTWQFMENERMRKKIVPWRAVGIDERELEPGDALLNWKRGGAGLRYCHWIGEDELRAMSAQAGLKVTETFHAGGREQDLSLYAILSMS